jgi:hypothetical protein
MKKSLSIITIMVLLTLVLAPVGCNRVGSSMNGSGKITEQDYKITGFNAVNIKGLFEAEIIQADAFKVTVSTDDNLISRVQISLDHRTLQFNIEAPATFFPTKLKARIEMPSIIGLNLSEKARATIGAFKSVTDFSVFLSQGSILTGVLEAGNTVLNLADASQISLKGSATTLEVDARSESKMDMEGFTALSANVKMSGASEAIFNVTGKFDVNLNDKSTLYYLGNPLFYDTTISGGSSMKRK